MASYRVVKVIRSEKINIVFTTGGYIAAPAILAAFFSRIPVILHESNAYPGRVTRLFGRLCDLVAIGMLPATNYLKNSKLALTGTPVRNEFFSKKALPKWVPDGPGPLLVVMGGSQGALGLNSMVRPLLSDWLEAGCRVVHLTGSYEKKKSSQLNAQFVEKEFCSEIPALLQNADLVISRAGAGAISELFVCGTPAVLVPYPFASDQHQEFNAAFAAELGTAVIVHQHESSGKQLKKVVNRLLKLRINLEEDDLDLLSEMQANINKLAVLDASQKIVQILESFN